jgi:hypothetical protein
MTFAKRATDPGYLGNDALLLNGTCWKIEVEEKLERC